VCLSGGHQIISAGGHQIRNICCTGTSGAPWESLQQNHPENHDSDKAHAVRGQGQKISRLRPTNNNTVLES